MDDRKKRIDDLIKNNRESRASLDSLLINFGESLYIRTKDIGKDSEDITQYNIYLGEIAELNALIAKIEEKNRRYKELEDAIALKENEEKERAKEAAKINRRLGKALLEDPKYDDYTSFYKEQSEALKVKLESLESRIAEAENKEGGNVFTWIGKSAQGLVLKSFLTKAEESRDQLYQSIGAQYGDREAVLDDEVAGIKSEIDEINKISKTAQNEIDALKDEKRLISASFGIEGNPQKQIQSVKNKIANINGELCALYRKFASQVCGIDEDIAPERKYFIDTIVTAEDGEIIGRASRLNRSIIENEDAIEKLKASLAIDEEKNKIDRFQRSITDKKGRIIDLQDEITALENNVSASEDIIRELEKLV